MGILLTNNYLSFHLSQNVFIASSFQKDIFVRYKTCCWQYFLFIIFFLATSVACRSAWARDWTHTVVVTSGTAAAVLAPQPTAPHRNFCSRLFFKETYIIRKKSTHLTYHFLYFSLLYLDLDFHLVSFSLCLKDFL